MGFIFPSYKALHMLKTPESEIRIAYLRLHKKDKYSNT